MTKFRARPVLVDAFLWTGGPAQAEDPLWMGKAIDENRIRFEEKVDITVMVIDGMVEAIPGEWIVRQPNGDIQPFSPVDFAGLYEDAE